MIDKHTEDAALLFDKDPKDVTPEQRAFAKEYFHVKNYTPGPNIIGTYLKKGYRIP